ncbi:MAG: hypothetical protein ACFFCJ_07890 [Promethearchaeota archaeon]
MSEYSSERIGKSQKIALKLYDSWVHDRQRRPDIEIPEDEGSLKKLRVENYKRQLAGPRRKHLEELKKALSDMTTADIVALLVMLELPALEISTLLHRLNSQRKQDSNAIYFSQMNQADNCGCGCGCGCAMMMDLPWVERINAHMDLKPFSIDPFNEIGLQQKERDALLISDFLRSFGQISDAISENINSRYY